MSYSDNLKFGGSRWQFFLIAANIFLFVFGLTHSYLASYQSTTGFFNILLSGINKVGLPYFLLILSFLWLSVIIGRKHDVDLLYDKITVWLLIAIFMVYSLSLIPDYIDIFHKAIGYFWEPFLTALASSLVLAIIIVLLWLSLFIHRDVLRRIFIFTFPILVLLELFLNIVMELSIHGLGF